MKICKNWEQAECGKQCCCHFCDDRGNCKMACTDNCDMCGRLIDTDECTSLEAMQKQSSEIIATITNITLEKARLDAIESEMKEKLKQAMEQYGVKKFENDSISVTYVDATTRTSVDSAKLKKDGLYDKYAKTSNVSASVRIKVK